MRLAILCLVLLSGCSGIVQPNPRQLYTDSGSVVMGDADPMLADAGTVPVEDGGSDGGGGTVCGGHEVGGTYAVTDNTCGFYAVNYRITQLSCPLHRVSGQLEVHCMQHVLHVPVVSSDMLQIDCDNGTFFCMSNLSAEGVLSIACTYGTNGTCAVSF